MKHIFIPAPKFAETRPFDLTLSSHTRIADGVRGILKAYPDSAQIEPASALVDPAGFALTSEWPPAAARVPAEISNWRARAVLEITGHLPAVESALAAIEGEAGIVARAAWSSGAALARDGATVVALSAALGITSEQIDAMFIQAEALTI
jgi:hypothetical protein